MSATVYIPHGAGLRSVEVPAANAYTTETAENGTVYLHLLTSSYSTKVAMFKTWDHVVISPNRDANGAIREAVALMAYEWETEEWRSALHADGGGTCYQHHFRPDGHGGGVCQCGETVSADEL